MRRAGRRSPPPGAGASDAAERGDRPAAAPGSSAAPQALRLRLMTRHLAHSPSHAVGQWPSVRLTYAPGQTPRDELTLGTTPDVAPVADSGGETELPAQVPAMTRHGDRRDVRRLRDHARGVILGTSRRRYGGRGQGRLRARSSL